MWAASPAAALVAFISVSAGAFPRRAQPGQRVTVQRHAPRNSRPLVFYFGDSEAQPGSHSVSLRNRTVTEVMPQYCATSGYCIP